MEELVAIGFILLVLLLLLAKTKETAPQKITGWQFAGKVIDGNVSNRSEFGIKDASTCRARCVGTCKAVEYHHDLMDSSNKECVYYDAFSSVLKSQKMPSDTYDGVWVKMK